jgi:hypothetical protein
MPFPTGNRVTLDIDESLDHTVGERSAPVTALSSEISPAQYVVKPIQR